MKKSIKSFILLSCVVSLIILAAGFSTSIAFPGSTSECGTSGCHDTSTLTLTSNATGPVTVTVGKPFILNIDAGGYSGGDQDFYVSIESSWADNDQFSFTPISIQDNGTGDINSNLNEISISVSFTPISAGTHILRIWTAAKDDVAANLDVTVTSEYDANAPIISNPVDIEYEYLETGSQIVWNATDSNPVNYTIFRNGTLVGSGGWNGSSISILVDWLIPGVYEYTLTVYNIGRFFASDSVLVTVTLTVTTTTTPTTTTGTTSTTTDTTSSSTDTTTSQNPPGGAPIDPAVVEPLSLVVGTWVGIIIVVLLISEILIRTGKC